MPTDHNNMPPGDNQEERPEPEEHAGTPERETDGAAEQQRAEPPGQTGEGEADALDQSTLDELLRAEQEQDSPLRDETPVDASAPGDDELLAPPSDPAPPPPDGPESPAEEIERDAPEKSAEAPPSPDTAPAAPESPGSAPPPEEMADAFDDSADEDISQLQAQLDQLFEEAAQSEAESKADAAEDKDAHAEVESVIAERQAAAQEEPERPVSKPDPEQGTLTQEDVDVFIAQQQAAAASPQEQSTETRQPDQEESLSQESLDALIAQQEEQQESPEQPEQKEKHSEEAADTSSGQQDQAQTGPEPPTPGEDAGQVPASAQADAMAPTAPIEEEADSRMGAQDTEPAEPAENGGGPPAREPMKEPEPVAETPSPPETEGELDQGSIDALLAASENQDTADEKAAEPPAEQQTPEEPAPVAETSSPPEAEGELDQGSIDALLAASGNQDTAEDETADSMLDQEALDNLLSEIESSEPAPSPEEAGTELDEPLVSANENDALDGKEPDAVLGGEGAGEAGELSQDDIDALMQGFAEADTKEPAPAPAPPEDSPSPEKDDDEVSQDMIESLVSAAKAEDGSEEVGSENVAAAAPSEGQADLLNQEDLDAIIEQAKQKDKERREKKQKALDQAIASAQEGGAAPKPEPEPAQEAAPEPVPAVPKEPGFLARQLRENWPRVFTGLAAGLLVAMGTFTTLYTNQQAAPDLAELAGGRLTRLEIAMRRAQGLIDDGHFTDAVQELEEPIEEAPLGRLRTDAEYLRLEALYKGFYYEPDSPVYDELQAGIDQLVAADPAHPRAPEAKYWQAKLYEKADLPYAAQQVYRDLIESYPDAPARDRILLEAAQLANDLRAPTEAAQYVQQLLDAYPGSPLTGQARLALADAYATAGMEGDARTIYLRAAQSNPYSPVSAEAFLRLGRLAYAQGRYEEAIRQLETRLATATTVQGNDEAYLLLAKCYRQTGELEQAESVLNDLLNFFPETESTADALVELSQVLEARGRRDEALEVAKRAAADYPLNPEVLRNKGELLGLAGDAFAAATAFFEADANGAGDPSLLLTAARQYRTAGHPDLARDAYALLKEKYAFSPQALEGGIELARLLYRQGEITEAFSRLEELLAATKGTEHHLDALVAMAEVARDLGLRERLVETSRAIARLAKEPEVLARAALALLENGELTEARALLERTDLARVRDGTAYTLLTRLGEKLLAADPAVGLETMEEAYLGYPAERNAEDEQRLLEAYLAANRTAAARRLVMEMAARTREQPVLAPNLIDAAITWGDHLYRAGDYRAAADAYEIAVDTATSADEPVRGTQTDPAWAKYQRANALLQLAEFDKSLELLEEIAASNAPWASDAGLKADYARVERRLRGYADLPTGQEG